MAAHMALSDHFFLEPMAFGNVYEPLNDLLNLVVKIGWENRLPKLVGKTGWQKSNLLRWGKKKVTEKETDGKRYWGKKVMEKKNHNAEKN
jgi:hypothetical protein